MSACLDPATLIALATDRADEAAREHVRNCARCRSVAEGISRFIGVDPVTLMRAEVEVIADIDDAVEVVQELLGQPMRRWSLLAGDERYVSPAAAQRLLTMSRDCAYQDRRRALALVEAASTMARALPSSPAVRLLRASVRKHLASMLYSAGRITDALAQLDAADEDLREVGGDRERAELTYARAWLYAQPDVWRMGDAADLVMQAARVFADVEPVRVRDCMHLLAVIHIRTANHAAAVALLAALYSEPSAVQTPKVRDRERAEIARDMAACYCRMGELSEAERVISEALRLDMGGGGETVALAFDRWILAKIAIRSGRFADALPDLDFAGRVFTSQGMPDYALRVRVDVVTATLGDDPDADVSADCAALVQDSMRLDAADPSRARHFSVDALAFLSEQATARALTVDCAMGVATFLASLHETRPAPFVRPLPRLTM